MMLTNYIVRNSCFRHKAGVSVKNKEIIDIINEKKGKFAWQDFANTWDVIVKNNDILVFDSIKDITTVSEVCGRKSLVEEAKLEKEWTPEEEAIIYMVECQFLEDKMTWTNYKKAWRIAWNDEQQRVVTELIKSAANNVVKPKIETPRTAKAMTEEDKERYTKLLMKKTG